MMSRWIARTLAALALALAAPAVSLAEPPAADKLAKGKMAKQEAADEVAQVGKRAPDFTLTDATGKKHTLSAYKGKVVVLEWTNPGCPYVKRHYTADTMETLAKTYGGKGVVWLAIDSTHSNTADATKTWTKDQKLAYPTLLDPDGAVGKRYGARTTPHMYVVDGEGTLRYAGAIDDDPKGTAKKPTNLVAAALDAVLAGKAPATSTSEPYGCTVKYKK